MPRTIKIIKNGMEVCTPAWKFDDDGTIIINEPCPYLPTGQPVSCSPTNEPNISLPSAQPVTETREPSSDLPSAQPIPQPCYQEEGDECSRKYGECIKDCNSTSLVDCLDICKNDPNSDVKCLCAIKKIDCEQTEDCKKVEGKCTSKADCVPSLFQECDDSLCNGEKGCTCLKPKCYQEEDDECSKEGGICIKNCEKVLGGANSNLDCLDVCKNKEPNSADRCKCLVKSPPCDQAEDCKKAEGKCVPKNSCIPTLFIECNDFLCKGDDECTCMKLVDKKCKQFDSCTEVDGKCVSKADCVPSPFQECDDSLCNKKEGCTCLKHKCYQEEDDECSKEGGKCIKNCDENPFVDCLDICKNDPNSGVKCQCAIKKIECEQTEDCKKAEGRCISKADCVPSLFQECDNSLCNEEKGCICLKPKCYQEEDDKCSKEGGKCIKNCRLVSSQGTDLDCLDICKNKEPNSAYRCECLVRNPPCDQTTDCKKAEGECMAKSLCIPGPFVNCDHSLCNREQGCTCKKSKCYQEKGDECSNRNGRCIKDCNPTSLVDCLDICKNDFTSKDKCQCEIKKTGCNQSRDCDKVGGKCIKNCVPSFTQTCKSLCPNKGCMCAIPTIISADCVQAVDGECITKYKGTCKKNCIETKTTGCADVCKQLGVDGTVVDRCFCEHDKTFTVTCAQTKACTNELGTCVLKEDCEPSKTVKCYEKLCSGFSSNTCICKITIENNPNADPLA